MSDKLKDALKRHDFINAMANLNKINSTDCRVYLVNIWGMWFALPYVKDIPTIIRIHNEAFNSVDDLPF